MTDDGAADLRSGFHARLRYLREKVLDETQAGLARAVSQAGSDLGFSISDRTVGNYESRTLPSADFLGALHLAYPQLCVEWLLTGQGEPLREEAEAMPRVREASWALPLAAPSGLAGRLPFTLQLRFAEVAQRYGAEGLADLLSAPLRALDAEGVLRYGQLSVATQRFLTAMLAALELAADAAER